METPYHRDPRNTHDVLLGKTHVLTEKNASKLKGDCDSRSMLMATKSFEKASFDSVIDMQHTCTYMKLIIT